MQREMFNFANTTIRRSIIKGCAVKLFTTAIDNTCEKRIFVICLPDSGDFEIIVKPVTNAVSEIVENEQEWEFLAQLIRWDYNDDRFMYVEDWECRVKGVEAEIGETIVIVNPIATDGYYTLGDKFKVLDKDDAGVKVAIDGCDEELLWWNGEPNTAFITHEEYEVVKNGKDN